MQKTLYIATVPSEDCVENTQKIWHAFLAMCRNVKVLGIQYDLGQIKTITDPEKLIIQPKISDTDMANALEYKMYEKDFVHPAFPQNEIGFEEYITTNAKTFGLAINGCGSIGTQIKGPHMRTSDLAVALEQNTDRRREDNTNVFSMAGGKKYDINAFEVAQKLFKLLETDFIESEERFKIQIINSYRNNFNFNEYHKERIGRKR